MPAMLARNVWGSTSSSAQGIRAITNSSSAGAAAVHAENLGTGPAVKASLTTTLNALSQNVALLLENGHIKSTSVLLPYLGTIGASGFAPPLQISSSINNATDVKGVVAINYTNTATNINAGSFLEQQIFFGKPYPAASLPVVILTPTTDMQGMDYRIIATSNTGFTIRVYRTSNPNSVGPTNLPPNGTFTFNYIVIE